MALQKQALERPPGPDDQFDLDSTPESLDRIVEYSARYGDIFCVFAPGRKRDTYVINDPNDVKRVLVNNHRNYKKGPGFDRVKILLRNGLIVSDGDFWKRQRMMMQPYFHRKVIRQFHEILEQCNRQLLDRWYQKADAGESIDVTSETSQVTLNAVLRSIFGDDLEFIEKRFGSNVFALVTEESSRDLRFAYKFRQLTKVVAELIRRRQEGGRERFDFVAMLMSARDRNTGEAMSEKELIDEIMTLIVAGHETTASALSWAWYLLSQHPEIEDRLTDELDSISGEFATVEELMQLKYTKQVIDETMRLYPPAWIVTRRALDHDRLGGYDVPPGADIIICPYVMHRHTAHWSNPEEFDPDRFSEKRSEKRHKFAYLPFIVGPRHCIGENFALFEMQIHLAIAARRFHLHFLPENPKVEMVPGVNLRTRHGLLMQPQKR